MMTVAAPALAATLSWDNDGAGAPSGGAGTWDASSLRWTSDAGANYVAWNNAGQDGVTPDEAVFGEAGGAVVLDGDKVTSKLTFTTGGYTLSGGQVAIGSDTTTRLVSNAGTNTLGDLAVSGRRGGANVAAGRLNITGNVNRIGGAGDYFEFKKTGAGTVAVYGDFTSSLGSEFPTLVQQGTMLVNSPVFHVSATDSLNVSTGATVGGTGVFRGNGQAGRSFIINGNIAPGDPIVNGGVGTFTLEGGSVDLGPNSVLHFDLAATTTEGAGINDLIQINTFNYDGSLKLDGILNINAYEGSLAIGSYRLFNYPTVSEHPSHILFVDDGIDLANSILPGGYSYAIDTSTLGQVNLVVTPEPGTLALATVGGLMILRRRARGEAHRRAQLGSSKIHVS